MSEATDEIKRLIDDVSEKHKLSGFVMLMTTTDGRLLTHYGNNAPDRDVVAIHTMASAIARILENRVEDEINNDPGNNTVEE